MCDQKGRWKSIQGWILDGDRGQHRQVPATLRLRAPNTLIEFEDQEQQMTADAGAVGFAIFQDDNVRAIILETEMFHTPSVTDSDGRLLDTDVGKCLAHEGVNRGSGGSHSLVFQWRAGEEIYVEVMDTEGVTYQIRMNDSETVIEVEDDSGPQTIRLSMEDL